MENNELEILGYELDYETDYFDDKYGISDDLKDKIEEIYPKILKGKRSVLNKLQTLIKNYPHIPILKNHLSVLYNKLGEYNNAKEVNNKILIAHPDYLIARINKAFEYYENEEYEKMTEPLNKGFDLQALYPERSSFHVNEFMGIQKAAAFYYAVTGDIEQALKRLHLIEEIEPTSEEVENIRRVILSHTMLKTQENINHIKEKSMTPTIIIEPIDESLKPGKFHFEITHQLYQHGFDIDEDILNQFLNLDRDQVIEDLENVIKGSIYNAENYLDEWTVDNSCFVIHSISLLGELEATQSLPLVLKTLKQDVEYHEFHWHLIASEILWIPILKLAKDQLPVLVDHMKTPGLYTLNKTPILSVLEQIYYHFPEKKDAILDVFEQLFQFYSNEEFENNILDTDLNGFLTWHVLDMGEKRLLPMIEKLYSKNYVNESVCGDLEYVKEEFSKSKRLMFENKSSIISIKERYIELLNETSEIYDDELDDNIDDKIDHELNDKILNDIVGLTENKNSNLIPSSETIINEKKVGRNALCPCGSGKKYKKCCLD